MKFFTIKEFTKIKKSNHSVYDFENNILFLEKKYFERLEIFVKTLLNQDRKNGKIFEIGYHIIEIKNYIGVLGIAEDFLLEILPKTYHPNFCDFDAKNTRKSVIKMISYLQKSNKKLPFATLNVPFTPITNETENHNFWELFIHLFLEEVKILLQKGLKYDYEIQEENLTYLKGNLVLNIHLQKNLLQKNHFFVSFDEFTQDILPNQYIKSTLILLQHISQNHQNLTKIQQYLQYFGHIKALNISNIYTQKFAKDKINAILANPFFKYYRKILKFCDFFLQKSHLYYFLSDKKEHFGIVILWNMEQIFEQYVATMFTHFFEKLPQKTLKIQEKKHFLVEKSSQNKKIFALRPDIVLYENVFEIDDFIEKPIKIWDTKWKILDKTKENFGISQADVYQMYVYAKKYNIFEITLLYPLQNGFEEDFWISFDDEIQLHISFFCDNYFTKHIF